MDETGLLLVHGDPLTDPAVATASWAAVGASHLVSR